ncbi:MAG: 4-hydroxy-3-methylbut-2-enyl diphosphate reductase [Bacteroidales bacterium]|nr:4-hydroxy-3-methylbut-2-enyl diphosphate reductase [Bacteroidales bacterium]
MVIVDIDPAAGFCFGVTDAIVAAEKYLESHSYLYCLGEIVHNDEEIKHLTSKGLRIIDKKAFARLQNETVLIRAHGEPQETYKIALENNIKLLDLTCPIVKKLQQSVAQTYAKNQGNATIVIFGKSNHPEVISLKGQVPEGGVWVVETPDDVLSIPLNPPVYLFSQTTKSIEEYREVELMLRKSLISKNINPEHHLFVHHTICKIVARRANSLIDFVKKYDVILFVSGEHSSNGKQLYQKCIQHNPRSYFISSLAQIDLLIHELLTVNSIGITGATSTSFRQMQEVKNYLQRKLS